MEQTGQGVIGKVDTPKKSGGKKRGIIGGIAVVLIAFIMGISIYSAPSNRIARQLDLGNRYLDELRYEQAIVAFDQVIAIDPKNTEAYLGKAQAYVGLGDIDMARQTLEEGYERTGDERLLEELRRLDPVIEWEDAAFEALIREYLGKPEGDIWESDVSDIERIVIMGIYIEMPDEQIGLRSSSYNSTAGLSYSFYSDKREVEDETVLGNIETLNDIKHFRAIRQLEVQYNKISDISILGNMTNLTYLNLSFNDVEDISALANLTNLEFLDLFNYEHRNISDISVLSGMAKLWHLSIEHTDISDISVLANLTSLEQLYLLNNNISDISALSNLTNLSTLDLQGNNISDIGMLSNLTNLTSLYLQRNNINDISVVGGMTNMRDMYLGDNNISNISVVNNLTQLETLGLDHNNISDVSALSGLTNLRSLQIYDNPISDYSPVSFVEDLRY